MGLKVITAPESYPISLDDAKAHLRVVDADEDTGIEAMIAAATNYAEQFLGRALVDQTLEVSFDGFPTKYIRVPMMPILEVVSVKYDDATGTEQTMDAGDYTVDLVGGRISFVSSWPSTYANGLGTVRVRFRAGYVDSGVSPPVENIPFDIKAAIKLIVGSLYAHRETVVLGVSAVEIPWSAEQLLRMHRIEVSMA